MYLKIRDRVDKTLFLLTLLVAIAPFLASAQSPQPGDIIISEFMADPSAIQDSDGEYVELYNKRSISFNIDGFTLKDDESNSHVVDNGGTLTIPAESFVVLARSSSPGFTEDYVYTGFTLSNSDDEIVLTDSEGIEIARLNYTSSQVSDGISSELNDINNIDSDGQTVNTNYVNSGGNIGNGDSGTPGSAGKTALDEEPTIRFLNTESNLSESSANNAITVVLEDPDGSDVEVDVIFQTSGSSAESNDFTNTSPVTLNFTSPRDGDQLTAYPVNNDSNFEGPEKAIFKLSNLSTSGAATIVSPDVSTVTISDDEVPDFYINEIHADPASGNSGDADGNGTSDSSHDEFIEFINNGNSDIDISGWQFSDDALDTPTLRHTFPEGTVVPAGGAVVLFADDGVMPEGGFGGAIVQSSNESPTLSLNNGGDDVELKDADGNTIVQLSYPDAGNGQSINRAGDAKGGAFDDHSNYGDAGGALFSPGTKLDGTAFGSKYAIGIRGSEGWRLISTPTSSTTLNELFGGFWMQGVTGSDAPSEDVTIQYWTESGGGMFTTPSNMDDNLEPGKGYAVYFFEDDEFNTPGIQGGFPKVVNTKDSENNSTVNVHVTSTDADDSNVIDGFEGWNLLGNPFGTDLSVSALIDALEAPGASSTSVNIQVWDPSAGGGQGSYKDLSDGDRIAPFQAFWIRYTSAGIDENISLNRNDLAANTGTQFYKEQNRSDQFEISLSLSDGKFFDNYYLEFSEDGTVELDRYDAYKLFSLNPDAINFYSTMQNNKLLKNALPRDMDTVLEVPLGFYAPGRESLSLSWHGINNLPDGWNVILKDTKLNKEVDLATVDKYEFDRTIAPVKQKAANTENPGIGQTRSNNGDTRFVVSITPAGAEQTSNSEIPEAVKLNQNYPNPFNPSTTISFELKEQAHVELNVYTIVGQKVATLVDEVRDAGMHDETWNAAKLPSGIYIAQLEVQGNVFIRKMTLIK